MPLDPILLGVVAAIAVVVIAIVIWQIVAVRKASKARDAVLMTREQLATARAQREAATGAEAAAAEDAVQAARRAVNAATREGEALRKRFPTSLYAGRIPAPEYEEAGGGTAEPPRIAF